MSRNIALQLLIAGVAALGLGVFAGGYLDWHHEDVVLLITLVAIAVASELFDFAPFPHSRISLTIAPILAAATFCGLPGVVVVAGSAAAADYVAHRKPLFKGVFNLGVLLLTGAAHVGVLETLASAGSLRDWDGLIGPVILGSLAAFAVNSALVAAAIGLHTARPPLTVWNESFRWMAPYYVTMGVLALFIAVAYDRWELWGLALLMAPLAVAWLAVKQYVGLASPVRAAAQKP
ncbi:MAG: hypothetical protein Q7T33_04460 [Dehalococcoidia bacterium]|nr:hypothetical protein [Dehalococcoidia bacterium]